MENAGPGSRRTWSRGVENAGSGGKRGVWWKTSVWWKTWGLVENTGSKWKTRGERFFAKI